MQEVRGPLPEGVRRDERGQHRLRAEASRLHSHRRQPGDSDTGRQEHREGAGGQSEHDRGDRRLPEDRAQLPADIPQLLEEPARDTGQRHRQLQVLAAGDGQSESAGAVGLGLARRHQDPVEGRSRPDLLPPEPETLPVQDRDAAEEGRAGAVHGVRRGAQQQRRQGRVQRDRIEDQGRQEVAVGRCDRVGAVRPSRREVFARLRGVLHRGAEQERDDVRRQGRVRRRRLEGGRRLGEHQRHGDEQVRLRPAGEERAHALPVAAEAVHAVRLLREDLHDRDGEVRRAEQPDVLQDDAGSSQLAQVPHYLE